MKLTLVAAGGTVTDPGTVTALLLLASATTIPVDGAEPVSVTVQESLSAPVIDMLLQMTELTVGGTIVPAPLKLTETIGALL